MRTRQAWLAHLTLRKRRKKMEEEANTVSSKKRSLWDAWKVSKDVRGMSHTEVPSTHQPTIWVSLGDEHHSASRMIFRVRNVWMEGSGPMILHRIRANIFAQLFARFSLSSDPFTREDFLPYFHSFLRPFPEEGHNLGLIALRSVQALCLVSKLARQVVSCKRSLLERPSLRGHCRDPLTTSVCWAPPAQCTPNRTGS